MMGKRQFNPLKQYGNYVSVAVCHLLISEKPPWFSNKIRRMMFSKCGIKEIVPLEYRGKIRFMWMPWYMGVDPLWQAPLLAWEYNSKNKKISWDNIKKSPEKYTKVIGYFEDIFDRTRWVNKDYVRPAHTFSV